MKHIKDGAGVFSIYSIRDGNGDLLKIQTCKAENIRRVIRFYKKKYPAYDITPIVHYYSLPAYLTIDDLLKEIDGRLSPKPVYNHNYTPRANTIRLQKLYSDNRLESELFRISLLGSFLSEYDEYDIYEDYHQRDETGDKLSYCDTYNATNQWIYEQREQRGTL